MAYQFTVSPDFSPDHISGWYIFNTWLQKQTSTAIHLEMYDSFLAQREAIRQGRVDLIYANPFDAATLVREQGFLPVARAVGSSDEAVLAVSAGNVLSRVEALLPGTKIAVTEDPDIRLIGMLLLEPADLHADNIEVIVNNTYVLVAKQVLQGRADVGVFLADAYDGLSSIIKSQLKVLVRSQINVIHHALMMGPQWPLQREAMASLLVQMGGDEKSMKILTSLGFLGWQKIDDEEMEFMIDLMDVLNT